VTNQVIPKREPELIEAEASRCWRRRHLFRYAGFLIVAAVLPSASLSVAEPILVFDGDSIAVGQGAPAESKLGRVTADKAKWLGKLVNVGRSGRPMATCLALYQKNIVISKEIRSCSSFMLVTTMLRQARADRKCIRVFPGMLNLHIGKAGK